MRIKALLALLSLLVAPAIEAQEKAIEKVISSQIEAFKSDDFDRAFQFASPEIQNRIRNPSNFEQMVRGSFPMMMQTKEIEFLDEKSSPPMSWHVVRLIGKNGARHAFAYEMILIGTQWRINGVYPLGEPDQSA